MVELFAKSGDPDQTPPYASDLGLQCLPVTRLGVSSLQWVKTFSYLTMKIRFETSMIDSVKKQKINISVFIR